MQLGLAVETLGSLVHAAERGAHGLFAACCRLGGAVWECVL